MLWGLWTSIIAAFLIGYARRQRYEAHVMAIFLSVLVFISIMLLAKSPFETIYAALPGQAMKGFIPADGKGLNPSLENLWIVIHPPMLFLGFSLLAVPFAFALAGLFKRDYQGWVVTSMPWTLGAAMVLGFGVMLGGFWAYETLGWGGFWAWDPVENASLLPWLITVAAAHSMLTQKRTGGLIRTNIALTLLAYALVLYGSFLTRSGVLGDASVHSFADPGYLAFTLLVVALAVFIIVPFGIFSWRWREMSGFAQDYKILSRETGLAIASALLGASALVVFIGTSAPLLKKKVEAGFYNNLHIPLITVLLIVNGLSLLLKWRESNWGEVWRKSISALIAAAIFTSVVVLFGVHDLPFIAVVAAASFALFVNLEIGWKILRGHWAISWDRTSLGENMQDSIQDSVRSTWLRNLLTWSAAWLYLPPAQRRDYLRRVWTAFAITLLLGIISLLAGTAGDYNNFVPPITQFWPYFAILFSILLTVFVWAGYPKFIFDTKFLGAYVAHVGLAVFVLGVIFANGYTKREIVRLPMNKPVPAFGGQYLFTFKGTDQVPNPQLKKELDDSLQRGELSHEDYEVKLQLLAADNVYWLINVANKSGYIATARPLTFWTDFNQRQSPIRNPSIIKFGSRDLYFTLDAFEQEGGFPKDTLGKMQEATVLGGKLKLKFINFDFPQSEKAKMFSQQPFHVKATVIAMTDVHPAGDTLTLGVTRNPVTDEAKEDDITVPGTRYHVQLGQLMPDMQNPANSRVVLRYFDLDHLPPPPTDVVTVEAFIKPWINL
ncbi:MAG TPA: cytochrome c biogenesis protein CcsA, partial [Candidatus Kapabacteria bacterium]|nr:cytochrome c biogenesis protein CcsA [Candidatus Kapabacteria bacterium]